MWCFLLVFYVVQGIVSSEPKTASVNPEVYMNISEIIRNKGYQAEEYEVITDDGYILTINRIPCGRSRQQLSSKKPVVLLQHGFALEGSSWIANMPNNSLGFMLADAGCDVWIGNNRGTSWSRKHQNLTVNQEQYSAYSFDEMATYDLPAIINFILEKTGMPNMHFVGFSQGATEGFIAFSSMPYLGHKIKMFYALAPLSTLKNSPSPYVKLLSLPDGIIKMLLGKKDFLLRSETKRNFTSNMCSSKIWKKLCSWTLSIAGGSKENHLNMSRIDVYKSHFPDSTSVQNLLHWGQVYKTGQLRKFDYGSENLDRYNQSEPPAYELECMRVRTAIWYGENDWFADPANIEQLTCRLHDVVYECKIPDWTHFDFLWGLDAPQKVYNDIIKLIMEDPYNVKKHK
uniref:lipase member M-like n=1 Tax=Euleptes europaea TaxID=460621 RepID=UPI002541FD65|nr:lipase member M-like [Euleptes europaea]